jgi:hypothetical protein
MCFLHSVVKIKEHSCIKLMPRLYMLQYLHRWRSYICGLEYECIDKTDDMVSGDNVKEFCEQFQNVSLSQPWTCVHLAV